MREIEFRGKVWNSIKNEWIWKYGPDIFGFIGSLPETIGQYIGLKDKNGVKIYEGDVVMAKIEGSLSVGVIKWIDALAGFALHNGAYFSILWHVEPKQIKVLGNIFDDSALEKNWGKTYREAQ